MGTVHHIHAFSDTVGHVYRYGGRVTQAQVDAELRNVVREASDSRLPEPQHDTQPAPAEACSDLVQHIPAVPHGPDRGPRTGARPVVLYLALMGAAAIAALAMWWLS